MSASLGVNPVCGPGKRYKVLACQNDRGEMEAANQCSLKRKFFFGGGGGGGGAMNVGSCGGGKTFPVNMTQ